MQIDLLKKMIASMNKNIKIYQAKCENAALEIIQRHDINMFLIDICLEKSSGLDLAMKIRSINKYEFSQIIFLTTHIEYITQAFKQTHCYDYILKPYNQHDVQAMLDKLITYENGHLNSKNDNLNKDKDRKIVITLKSGIFVSVKINDIIFIEVIGRNCEVNTINGVFVANNVSLKKLLKVVDCKDIIQSHRAFAVNTNNICKIEKLSIKLKVIYFNQYAKTALLGYKFKDNILLGLKRGKEVL